LPRISAITKERNVGAEEDLKASLDKAEGRILELEAQIEHLKAIIAGLGGHVPDR
jgi:hypothetical protein